MWGKRYMSKYIITKEELLTLGKKISKRLEESKA